MYEAIWRHLPGPTWFKVIEALILILAVIAVLFLWVFPWASQYFKPDATVGHASSLGLTGTLDALAAGIRL